MFKRAKTEKCESECRKCKQRTMNWQTSSDFRLLNSPLPLHFRIPMPTSRYTYQSSNQLHIFPFCFVFCISHCVTFIFSLFHIVHCIAVRSCGVIERAKLSFFLIPRLHDQANIEQSSSKHPANAF